MNQRLLELRRRMLVHWHGLGPRRSWIAGGCAGLVVLLTLGVWSCHTTPVRRSASPDALALRATGEPEVRVRIRKGVETTRLEGPSQFTVRPLSSAGVPRNLPGPLEVSTLQDGIRITDGRDTHWGYRHTIEIIPATRPGVRGSPDAGEVPLIRVDGTPYAGRIRIVPRDAVPSRSASAEGGAGSDARPARFDVIEVVSMETYIPGVTVSELWGHWAPGAFQAQSVAARTYAMQQRERAQRLGRDYDLESTVLDQAYNGWTNHAVANQAAAETRGVVLKWQDRLLRAYYSSTCGGRAAGASEVWPTTRGFEFNLDGPIQAHQRETACDTSRFHRWEVVRDRTELSTRLREWGRANGNVIRRLGELRSIEPYERNSTGRPVRYLIRDDKGQRFELGAEYLRNACNFNYPGLTEIKGVEPLRVLSGDVEVEIRGSKVTIRGRGFGHGVGMCQYCVQEMAKRGDYWRVILNRFYPGARLERMY